MNIFFTLKDFEFDINDNTFFEGANISDGNYDDDIDQRIDTFLYAYRNKDIKSFTVPVSISNNFMEFSGLIFAHHLRLTRELTFCDTLIIFYGTLELEELLRLTPLAQILITRNILYINIIKYSFDDIKTIIQSYKPKSFLLTQFLDQIQINPPSNYDSHHSIDNEFALIQWSGYINCLNNLPQHFKKEFDSQLYFKYLRAKYELYEINDCDSFVISTLGKIRILLIDDEAKKGWEKFYESFFRNSKIKFEDSGVEFKNEDQSELILKIESRVKNFNPHLVLLDLRMHDADFVEDADPKNMTGMQILEKIKVINSGIQVVITTASNKAWNFNLAKQKGAYDFIIKDGFESPTKAIGKLKSTIENGSKKSVYLMPIYKKMLESLKVWNSFQIPKRKNINDQFHDPLWHINLKLQVNDFIKNAFDTINNDAVAERFTISTLLLYRVIEMLNEFYIIESGNSRDGTNQYHFDQDNSKVPKITYSSNSYFVNTNVSVGKSLSTKEKAYAVYYNINGNTNKVIFNKLHQLTEYRNKVTIHPSKRFKEESLEYILDSDFKRFDTLLFDYFSAILDYINSFK
jgi:CheY-like chemotaxis protein